MALPYADVNLVAVPDALDSGDVASLGCRFATAFRAVVESGTRPAGGMAGRASAAAGVGLSAIMIGVALGARVIGVDVKPEALALARVAGRGACPGRERDCPTCPARFTT